MRNGFGFSILGLPFRVEPFRWWVFLWHTRNFFGLFRNRPGIIPQRWGGYVLGFEVGWRGGRDRAPAWLVDRKDVTS